MKLHLDDIELVKIRLPQREERLEDIPGKLKKEYEKAAPWIHEGMRVAIAAGSRGITNIDLIVRETVQWLKSHGADPFIVPAMGSHGGATAEGQRQVLESYGITEEKVGAPVVSSMEVVSLGKTKTNPYIPVWMDKNAYNADGILLINRVKAHTDFHGRHESGIVKMLTIGLGKQAQALAVHAYGADGLKNYIPDISKKVLESGKIIGALGIIEDGYDNTADLVFARPEEIFQTDEELLKRSKNLMARLPFEKIDVLIVDEMGKNISGTGLDTNVIGRLRIKGQEDGKPECGKIAVFRLTEESHGNALGIGLADVVTKQIAEGIDWTATYQNVITSGFLERGFLPIQAETDKNAAAIAVRTCGAQCVETIKMARIKNTLELDEIYVSRALWKEIENMPGAMPLGEWKAMEFSECGRAGAF